MAVTHSTDARNAATDAVTALIGASGKLVFRLAGNIGALGTAVATLNLSVDGFGEAVAGVATAGVISDDISATGNASPVATATIETSASVVVIHCEVAGSGADINMINGLVVAAGDKVSCSSLTYAALPD